MWRSSATALRGLSAQGRSDRRAKHERQHRPPVRFDLDRTGDRAVAVPQTDETLLVPRMVAGEVVAAMRISNAGSWIRPPPPTTASTQPALKAATISTINVAAWRSGPGTGQANAVRTAATIFSQRICR